MLGLMVAYIALPFLGSDYEIAAFVLLPTISHLNCDVGAFAFV